MDDDKRPSLPVIVASFLFNESRIWALVALAGLLGKRSPFCYTGLPSKRAGDEDG